MAIPNLTITGMAGVIGNGPFNYMQDNLQFRDTATWVIGSHDFQFGFLGTDMRENDQQSGTTDRPSFTFNNLLDFVQDDAVTESATPINLKTLTSAGAFKHYRNSYLGAFAQDKLESNKKSKGQSGNSIRRLR